jgi:predicted lipid carrier protein YhbT
MNMTMPRQLAKALECVPLPVVQRLAEAVFAEALRRHPRLFDRLGEYASRRYRFTATDLNMSFVIRPDRRSIQVHRHGLPPADAAASGPMVMLLALLEGRVDGDAVFFSRALRVAGDMEAILALRNALDDSGFDLPSDISAVAGPLAPVFRPFAERLRERALASLS